MSTTAKYVLVCDEVRKEDNGKLIIIGLYTPDIAVPQIPFTFPALTFVIALEADRPAEHQLQVTLGPLESGRPLAQAMGMMQIRQPGMGTSILRFGNLRIEQVGGYSFSVRLDSNSEPFIVHNFNVILRPSQGG